MNIPKPFRGLIAAGVAVGGSVLALSGLSSVALGVVRNALEAKRKKSARPCETCRGKEFIPCKLCKGNSSIEWSPLYAPIFINPCKCPTCDGRCIQRCLNCIGKGYV